MTNWLWQRHWSNSACRQRFLGTHNQAQTIKEKTDKLDSSKLKLLFKRHHYENKKANHRQGENSHNTHIWKRICMRKHWGRNCSTVSVEVTVFVLFLISTLILTHKSFGSTSLSLYVFQFPGIQRNSFLVWRIIKHSDPGQDN